jgi:nucleotide-binding universal stress UspA family protein
VVAGSQGSGRWPGRLLGSVSSGLLRHAHCPVAIIHYEDTSMTDPAQTPVLVGIDGSPASELATAIAFDEASRRHVGLVALHAWSDVDVSEWPGIDWPATQSMAEEVLAERLAGWYPDVQVRRAVVQAQPARQLVQRSEDAQLVVVGSRGRGGFAGMLVGSVGETVAQMAQVPVIVARESLA